MGPSWLPTPFTVHTRTIRASCVASEAHSSARPRMPGSVRAVPAVRSQPRAVLDQLLALAPNELTVLTLNDDELKQAVRPQSRRPEDRAGRHSLGAKARRLDAGESASIAIAGTGSWPLPATTKIPSPSGRHCRASRGGRPETCSAADASEQRPDGPEAAMHRQTTSRCPPAGSARAASLHLEGGGISRPIKI